MFGAAALDLTAGCALGRHGLGQVANTMVAIGLIEATTTSGGPF